MLNFYSKLHSSLFIISNMDLSEGRGCDWVHFEGGEEFIWSQSQIFFDYCTNFRIR
jgi:hypothetical protein